MDANNQPFVHLDYLPVADNTAVTGEASAITQAGKLVALDDLGKINRYFVPYNELSVTSLSITDGEKITGDIKLYSSGSVTVSRSGNNFYFGSNFAPGVTGIQVGDDVLTGKIGLIPGSGLSITADALARTITFRNEGVISINGLKENITIQSANGIVVSSQDASTLVFDISGVQWSQFDTTSAAVASKVMTSGGIFLDSNTFASLYTLDYKTILRGEGGVLIPDPLQADTLTLSGGNGLFLGDSRIHDVSGILYLSPSSGAIVVPTGSDLLGVEAIEPGFSGSVTLNWTQAGTIVSHTFTHSKGLNPLSVLVTKVQEISGVEWETTQGFGVDLTSDYGYNVLFTDSAFIIQARSTATGTQTYNIRSVFQASRSAAPLPAPAAVTSAPIKPFVSLVGVPSGGGFATEDILLSTRPVTNATSYIWERIDTGNAVLYSWETTTPLLSTLTTPESYIPFRVTKPGVFRHTVQGKGGDGVPGPSVEFDITIRPLAPTLSVLFLNVQDDTSFPFKTADIVVYSQTGFIRIIDDLTGFEMIPQSTIPYVEPASSLNDTAPIYPELVANQVTLTKLLPNTSYRLKAQAYLDDTIYSDFSPTFDIYIPS